MKVASVIGHFAFGKEYYDGQTVKTKIITKELEQKFGADDIYKIDTHGGVKVLVKLVLRVFKAMRECSSIIMLPANNGLCFLTPVLSFYRLFFKRKLFYVVIGGWLADFLNNKKTLVRQLKKFDGIYVETNTMKKALENMGFANVSVMPNCKELHILKEDELVYSFAEPLKLCTFSRVMKEKGIEDAAEAVKAVNEKYGREVFTLDIYGQVSPEQKAWFDELKSKFPDYIKYSGLAPFDKSTDVLKNYHALLFPTYYEGEGFAGTLIDAMAAGVPVIAGDWKYNSEIVRDGINGFVCPVKDVKALSDWLEWSFVNKEKWDCMKKHCVNEAVNYLPRNVMTVLINKL